MTEGEVVAEDDAVVVEEQVKKVPRDMCPCFYCGQKYGGLGGLKGHLYYWELNPVAKKKKKNHVKMIVDIQKSAEVSVLPPCIFCGERFSSQEKVLSNVEIN